MTRSTLHRSKAEPIGETPVAVSEKSDAYGTYEFTLFQVEALGHTIYDGLTGGGYNEEPERLQLLVASIYTLCDSALQAGGCR